MNLKYRKMTSPIGIFDSGIGGLLIAKEIKIHMPNEYIIYFGDNANMPYGEKSKEFIKKCSMKIAYFLYKKNCKAIVIACNTMVTNSLDIIQKEFCKKILIFNVVEPVIKTLVSSKKVGLMATPATIRSNFFKKEIEKYFHHLNLDLIQIETPLLAPIIENGLDKKKINSVIESYLKHLQSIDTLLLACTHYLFFKHEIDSFYHGKVRVIDVQKIVVQYIQKKLHENNLLSIHSTKNPIFYTSSSASSFFQKQVKLIFGKEVFFKQNTRF
ncbi:glutamate racemase [Blattabacterium cuenoti]|uniref:glutamate racemase n=1 Tax=Blattabacterium cuenoti TaxID=1653831 RepID=UPI00163D20D2|nr:glutamate racemase [Blattabacterium cuenoti]